MEKNLNQQILLKKLTKKFSRANGRNNQGKITVRHRGGGHKRLYKIISFKRNFKHEGIVLGIYYDPNRSARIAGIFNKKLNSFFLILAPNDLVINSFVKTSNDASLKVGNTLSLKKIPIGSKIHNITLQENGAGKLIRSAGTYAELIRKVDNKYAEIRLKSGELRLILLNNYATLGIVSNIEHKNRNLQKAGRSRWLNRRPVVRGVAKNPVDHPHGGGEGKTSGGRPSVSPWGKITKGQPTRKKKNKYILERRKK
jgi:large subunit ribosomal protein L2